MTTNRRPLIMMWSKTAPKGTKRAKVASTTDGAATHHGKPEEKMKVADLAMNLWTRTAWTNWRNMWTWIDNGGM